jgi:hypothetical protein
MSLAAIIVATGMTTALAEGPVCPPPEFPLATVEITVITVGSGGSSTTRFVGFGEGTFERASRTGTRETKKFQLKQEDVVAVVNRVYATHFFSLKDSYGDEEIAVLKDPATVQTQVVHESCGGGVTITVKLGKCTKTARVDPGAPRELTDLVQYLERVANERVVR